MAQSDQNLPEDEPLLRLKLLRDQPFEIIAPWDSVEHWPVFTREEYREGTMLRDMSAPDFGMLRTRLVGIGIGIRPRSPGSNDGYDPDGEEGEGEEDEGEKVEGAEGDEDEGDFPVFEE